MNVGVNDVACYASTTAEPGADEIAIGGIATNPQGDMLPIGPMTVSDDFDEGETVAFNHVFATWHINTDANWPHVYVASIALAEKDDGGFWKMIHDLWEQVAPQVKAAIGAGVGAAIGGVVGGLIGAAVGTVVGAVIGWPVGLGNNPDDYIAMHMQTVALFR